MIAPSMDSQQRVLESDCAAALSSVSSNLLPAGSCWSRGTSVGSSLSHGADDYSPDVFDSDLTEAASQPDCFAGVEGYCIRNTFINAPVGRPVSLEGFFQERSIRSCPASRPLSVDCPDALPAMDNVREGISEVEVPAAQALQKALATIAATSIEPDPIPVVIRNTFIDVIGRPMSLEGFFRERVVNSCPASRQVSVDDFALERSLTGILEEEEPSPTTAAERPVPLEPVVPTASVPSATLSDVLHGERTSAQPPSIPPPPSQHAPTFDLADLPPPPAAPALPGLSQACVLRLAQIFPGPELGSAELPSAGSEGHHSGQCKPCAFLHTRGCTSGKECVFCHLCPRGEKKRRKAVKKSLLRDADPNPALVTIPEPASLR